MASSTGTPLISIVGEAKKFFMPHPLDLTLGTTDDGDTVVTDMEGKIVLRFKVDECAVIHSRAFLLDAAQNHILTIQKKLRSRSGRLQVFKGNKSECLLFSAKYIYSSSDPTKLLDVFLPTNTEEEVPDFKVRGNWEERTCTFYAGDSIIAEMSKKQEDKFNHVTVYPNIDYVFIVALTILLAVVHVARENPKGKDNDNFSLRNAISAFNFGHTIGKIVNSELSFLARTLNWLWPHRTF